MRIPLGISAFLFLIHLVPAACAASSADSAIVLRPDNFLEELARHPNLAG